MEANYSCQEFVVIISAHKLEVRWIGFAPADNWASESDPDSEQIDHQQQ